MTISEFVTEKGGFVNPEKITAIDLYGFEKAQEMWKDGFQKGAEFGYNKAKEWHLIQDVCPSEDKLVRVLTYSNEEYICRTELYYPSEDEIGYGHAIIYFYELNGDWVDSSDIKAWCELQPLPKEFKEIE